MSRGLPVKPLLTEVKGGAPLLNPIIGQTLGKVQVGPCYTCIIDTECRECLLTID